MRIISLKLTNWMAFRGTQVLEGIPALPVAIVGRYDGNPRRSNWSGKTALLESIGWALYAEKRKPTIDSLIHHGEKEMAVEVFFDTGHVVTRVHPRGGPSRVRLTMPDGAVLERDAAEEAIEKLLAMTWRDLTTTVLFEQGDTEAIVGKNRGERRSIIARWLDLERWERAGVIARKRFGSASQALEQLGNVTEVPPQMTQEQIDKELAEIERRNTDNAALEIDGDEAASELAALNAKNVKAELERVVEDGRRARQSVTDLGAIPTAAERDVLAAEEQKQAGALGVAQRRAEELGEIIDHGFDGVCPVMGEACPAAMQVGATVEQHDHLVTEARAEVTRLVQLHRSARDALIAHGRRVQDITVAKTRLADATQRYRELKAKDDDYLALLAVSNVEELKRRIEVGREAAAARLEDHARARYLGHLVADLKRRAEAKRELEAKIENAKRESRILAAVAKALGGTGISQRIAADQLLVLEDRANAQLEGTGLSFSFGWERDTKEIAPVCLDCGFVYKGKRDKECPACTAPRGQKRSDELEILVDDGSGEIEDVKLKSGGAKAMVASAIRLSGGAMFRETRGSTVAWAIVDEPFGALDAENREGLARTFTSMLGSVGLEQAFVVSHDAALLDALPARIIVHREDGWSRLELQA